MGVVERRAARKHVPGHTSGQLGTGQRQAKAITRHWIDKTGGIARQQQPRLTSNAAIDGHRPEHHGRAHGSRMRKAGSQVVVRVQAIHEQLEG